MIFYKKTQTVSSVLKKAIEQRDNFLKDFLEYVDNHESICLFQHVNPDGDCIGGILGLKQILKNRFPNKKIYAIGQSDGNFPWLNMEFDTVPIHFDISKSLAIIVDVGSSARIYEYNSFFQKPDRQFGAVIKIDHHGAASDISLDLEWDDSSYVACCCQLVQMCEYFGWEISPKAATYFYLGIVTDSGFFKYETVVPRTLILAAKAMRYQADAAFVARNLGNRTFDSIEAEHQMIKQVKKGKKVLWSYFTKKDCERLGFEISDLKVSTMANIEDNLIWILFAESEAGRIKVDFRSIGVSVRELAIEFGGGGHVNASGCVIDGESNIQVIVDKAQELAVKFSEEKGHTLASAALRFDDNFIKNDLNIESDEFKIVDALGKASKSAIADSKEEHKGLVESAKEHKVAAKEEERQRKENEKVKKEEEKQAKQAAKEAKAAAATKASSQPESTTPVEETTAEVVEDSKE